MRIQYASDLHLDKLFSGEASEINYKNLIDPSGDILILAGDICHCCSMEKYRKFFDYVSENFSYVLYTPGNHEFYNDNNKTISESESDMKKFFSLYTNIVYLNNNSVIINNYLFIGSCFWEQKEKIDSWFRINTTAEEINRLNNESKEYINKILKTFNTPKKYIIPQLRNKPNYQLLYSKNKFSPPRKFHKNNQEGFQTLKLLDDQPVGEEIDLKTPYKVIITTHYPPISYSQGKPWCKQNEFLSLKHLYNVWINGHTHRNHTKFDNNILYIANQYRGDGYNNSVCFVHKN